MDIPNLNHPSVVTSSPSTPVSKPIIVLIIFLAVSLGFWGSRLMSKPGATMVSKVSNNALVINPETITDSTQIQVGKLYGNLDKTFKDSATGTIEKGSINGEGTHILNRAGGVTQRAALTSSVVDLDLFVGKKVQVTGETNASTKASWLLDVGTIKIIE